MTPDDLARAGRALFGPTWQSDVARLLELGSDVQSGSARVRAMMSGKRPIRPGMMTDLAREMRARSAELASLADEIEARAASEDHVTPPRSHAQR